MALIRLTAENAEEVVQQVVGDFAALVRTSGKSPALTKLDERATELESLVTSGVLEVEIILGEVETRWLSAIATWLQIDETVLQEAISSQEQIELPSQLDQRFSVVRIRSGQTPSGRRAGQRKPPIVVVVHTPDRAPDKDLKDAIFEAVQEHPLSLLLVPAEAGWAKALAKLASRDTWMCKAIGLELMAERDLKENLELSPWKEARSFMIGWSAVGSMGSLHQGLDLALEKEKRSLKSKRTVLDQSAAVSQQRATGNTSEIIAEVRGHIQKQFDSFKADSAKRMQSLVAPFDGELSEEIETSIKSFNQFEFEKKPKIFVIRVPAAVQNHLLTRTNEVLAKAGRADLVAMGEVFSKVQEEVEKLIESKGGPPTVVHFNYLPDHELTNLLNRSIAIQRPYSGTLARRGPMDYFMAARRYQMIFFMMFSAFGLSFVRSYRQFMVPMTVLLLSGGLLNVINSTRKQEKEAKAVELEKARELMRAELRRSMNEIDKMWTSNLANHLASQQTAVVERIEAAATSFFEGASRKAADEKVLQQRQIKGLDQSERKIAEADKKIQSAPQELEQLMTQLTQMYVGIIRPNQAGPPVPGAVGLAATPRPGAAAATPAATPAVPAAAAAALEKLKGGKPGAAGSKPAPAGGASDLKKKLAEARGQKAGSQDRARPAERPRRSAPTPAARDPKQTANKPEAPLKPAARGSSDLAEKAARLRERAAAISKPAKAAGAGAAAVSAGASTDQDTEAKVSQDAVPKRSAVEKRVAELQEKMKEAKAAKKEGDDQSAPGSEAESDRGALMQKKAEEIKRKMAEASEGGAADSDGLDKTVMMPKPPPSTDSDSGS